MGEYRGCAPLYLRRPSLAGSKLFRTLRYPAPRASEAAMRTPDIRPAVFQLQRAAMLRICLPINWIKVSLEVTVAAVFPFIPRCRVIRLFRLRRRTYTRTVFRPILSGVNHPANAYGYAQDICHERSSTTSRRAVKAWGRSYILVRISRPRSGR